MLWYGHENGTAYLYGISQTKHGGQLPWQVVRIPADKRMWQGGWEPVNCLPCRAKREEAEKALREYAKTQGWIKGDCGRCWHLDRQRTGCGFFDVGVERVPFGYFQVSVRCAQCLDWGSMPPG